MQLLHVDDLVDAVRLAMAARHDAALNVAGAGVLPLSTVVKLVGRLRCAAPEAAIRAALHALWVAGVGAVPGAHVAYLRDTFVADATRAVDAIGFRPRYDIRDALAQHVAWRRGAVRPAA